MGSIKTLLNLLLAPNFRVISFVGGGGKSTLLGLAGAHLRAYHRKAIFTTTTKMWLWQLRELGRLLRVGEVLEGDLDEIRGIPFISLIKEISGDKVVGVSPEELELTMRALFQHTIFVEADGAKGMPIKAHSPWEPVVPSFSDLVVGIIGLDCLFRRVEEVVFRIEEFLCLHGLKKGDSIDLHILQRHVNHRMGLFKGVPVSCRRAVLFNKLDIFRGEMM
ncbi:MAG: selenium cofactor biosynthesis protein YqeC [Desulfatiglandales bacterium]